MKQIKMQEKILKSIFLFLFLFSTNALAVDIDEVALELKLYAGTKASIQWKRVFSSQRKLRKYNLDKLSENTRNKLKNYLINHAADSEQPIVPGL